MTKTSVFNGHEDNEKRASKPIEFVYAVDSYNANITMAESKPSTFNDVMLMSDGIDREGFDVMLAWNDNSTIRMVYLGHWNDGVV